MVDYEGAAVQWEVFMTPRAIDAAMFFSGVLWAQAWPRVAVAGRGRERGRHESCQPGPRRHGCIWGWGKTQ
eukprot:1881497-Lingulodinium_polyedra.AAC.1